MRDDLFPVFENNEWRLQPRRPPQPGLGTGVYAYAVWMATSFPSPTPSVLPATGISSLQSRNGYDQLAIAGFSDIHKTLIVGQPVGLITGSRYLRDPAGRLMIGSDGFQGIQSQEYSATPIPGL